MVGMTYTLGSLFSGIGGLELGFEMTGAFKTIWQCEIDKSATQVLEKHWPNVTRFTDVKKVGKHNLEPVDAIIGGFPCQDLSYAGKGAGIHAARSGLWWEYHRIINELRPRIAVMENVPGLFTRGLSEVLGSLSEIGFDAEWRVVSAASQGAWHQRDRVFIVAYASSKQIRREQITTSKRSVPPIAFRLSASRDVTHTVSRRRKTSDPKFRCVPKLDENSNAKSFAHADSKRFQALRFARGSKPEKPTTFSNSFNTPEWAGGNFRQPDSTIKRTSIKPHLRGVVNGIPERLDLSRSERLRLLGNAVVPQVAQFVANCILESGVLE
jgi:DNA (cytosine-5)-methyltransferase 1